MPLKYHFIKHFIQYHNEVLSHNIIVSYAFLAFLVTSNRYKVWRLG
jgi:hypothetical protein